MTIVTPLDRIPAVPAGAAHSGAAALDARRRLELVLAGLWLLWGGLAALAVQPAVRAPHAFGGLLAGLAGDAPGWLAKADQEASAVLAGHGLVASARCPCGWRRAATSRPASPWATC